MLETTTSLWVVFIPMHMYVKIHVLHNIRMLYLNKKIFEKHLREDMCSFLNIFNIIISYLETIKKKKPYSIAFETQTLEEFSRFICFSTGDIC